MGPGIFSSLCVLFEKGSLFAKAIGFFDGEVEVKDR